MNVLGMSRKSAFVVFCLLLFQMAVAAQQPSAGNPQAAGTTQQPAAKDSYETLLERVKKQDPTVNFTALRLAYTETKQYSPYGGDRDSRDAMLAAVREEDNEKALALSEKILADNYLDVYAHVGAFAANKHLGRAEKSDYHKYVYENLLKSIKDSGDGKSMETAFVVISTDEEYVLFNYLGLRPAGQALIEAKGHAYDRMTALDPKTNQRSTYYFNIDKPFKWLANSLKN